MRKDFNDCLELIESQKIRAFTKTALELAPSQFWTAPSSSSGKYHPPEDQVEGGIIVHSRKAVRVALDLFRFFNIINQLAKDKVISACILHDIQKNGTPWGENTNYEHGPIAAKYLTKIAKDNTKNNFLDENLLDIIMLVKNHMGLWNKPYATSALKTGSELSQKAILYLIVQMADYWASRKWCPFVADEFEK